MEKMQKKNMKHIIAMKKRTNRTSKQDSKNIYSTKIPVYENV